jgi:hypothetical protein
MGGSLLPNLVPHRSASPVAAYPISHEGALISQPD